MTDEQAIVLYRVIAAIAPLMEPVRKADLGMVGFMLENVLHDARAALGNAGRPLDPPPDEGKVVPFKR